MGLELGIKELGINCFVKLFTDYSSDSGDLKDLLDRDEIPHKISSGKPTRITIYDTEGQPRFTYFGKEWNGLPELRKHLLEIKESIYGAPNFPEERVCVLG